MQWGLPGPDYIKIDVDGFEHPVINGPTNSLRHVKSLCIEIVPNIPEQLQMIGTLKVLGSGYDEDQDEQARRKDGTFPMT